MERLVKVSRELRDDQLIKSIGLGLHWIAIGERPISDIPNSKPVTTRFRLDAKSAKIFEEVLPDFESERQLFSTCLVLLSEKPRHCLFNCN